MQSPARQRYNTVIWRHGHQKCPCPETISGGCNFGVMNREARGGTFMQGEVAGETPPVMSSLPLSLYTRELYPKGELTPDPRPEPLAFAKLARTWKLSRPTSPVFFPDTSLSCNGLLLLCSRLVLPCLRLYSPELPVWSSFRHLPALQVSVASIHSGSRHF